MGNMVDLVITVSSELADRLVNQGMTEVVTRQADAKFDAFTKCLIKIANTDKTEALQSVLSVISDLKLENSDLKKQMVSASRQLTKLSKNMKTLVSMVSDLGPQLASIKNLEYLNAGLGLVNLAVDVAGFVYIGMKLDEVQRSIEKLSSQIGQVKFILTSEKLSDFQRLSLRFSAIAERLKDGDAVKRTEIVDLLINMRAFLSEMIRNMYFDAMDMDILLQVVFDLLAAYTAVLNLYIRDYYFEKNRVPENLEAYTSLYGELLDDRFSRMVGDYLILRKGLGIEDMIQAIRAQKTLILNCKLKCEDQIDMLKLAETKENYDRMIGIIDQYVRDEIEEKMNVIKDEEGIDEAKAFIHERLEAMTKAVGC